MSSIFTIFLTLPVAWLKTFIARQSLNIQFFRLRFHTHLDDNILSLFRSLSYSKIFVLFEILEILEFLSLRKYEIAAKLLKINQI